MNQKERNKHVKAIASMIKAHLSVQLGTVLTMNVRAVFSFCARVLIIFRYNGK